MVMKKKKDNCKAHFADF
jgi:hypothetical protein